MIQERVPLKNKSQTAVGMKKLINKYYNDLKNYVVNVRGKRVPVENLTIEEFHNVVRNIPYRQDTKPKEVIARPRHLLNHRKLGLDCKKKGVLMAAFFKLKGIPYRLIGSSSNPNRRIHHVFPQAFLNGEWCNMDATYNYYRPYEKKRVTKYEIL